MASPLVSRVPQCFNCIRRTASSLRGNHLFPAGQQIRGKKTARTKKKPRALLLQDIKGYGPRGSILSVPAGVMRNWFASRQADYATDARLAELGIKEEDVAALRAKLSRKDEDIVLGKAAVQQAETSVPEEEEVTGDDPISILAEASAHLKNPTKNVKPEKTAKPEKASPEEKTAILSNILPASVDFYRTPIAPVKAAPKVSSSVAAKAKVVTARGTKEEPTSIVGVVSTTDISVNLMALLAQREEGKHIELWPEDIVFVNKPERTNVEHLGTFEVDIKIKGASTAIRRTINVKSQG
ncbi:hypothetical protein HYFRA_00006762 [Hymenoscyphus fraxineus]|uniref:Ribosomal protein L9 domain-containing protein n=1 Tax=Hymenoscyphus fraxineus TaxID=746836 RepID=A0A9N9PNR6_9HELO|nr:hypothetical protein HYFRA_00006762 [Hymenoscyphus fraxineus]